MARRRSGTNIVVTLEGKVLEGAWPGVMRAAMQQAITEVGRLGVNELHSRMGRRFRHPTGHFESGIVTDRAVNSMTIDDPIVYGPWLEGTSQRNQSTRFRGYKLFRLTRLRLKKIATPVAQRIVDVHVGRLNR